MMSASKEVTSTSVSGRSMQDWYDRHDGGAVVFVPSTDHGCAEGGVRSPSGNTPKKTAPLPRTCGKV